MRQVGKDEDPIDLSVPGNVELFQQEMAAWGAKRAGDKELKEYGFIDWTQGVKPYGVCRELSWGGRIIIRFNDFTPKYLVNQPCTHTYIYLQACP